MKIKNIRVFAASALVFAVIGVLNSCSDYKLNHQSKVSDGIKNKMESVTFEDIFVPAEETKINLKPDVLPGKSK